MSKNNEKVIPISVIKRLPMYHRCLTNLINDDIIRISSKELAEKLAVTASQIRQDLSHFGNFGQRGYGYRVEELQQAIAEILGIDNVFNMILLGAGNLGTAIVNYPNFKRRGFIIKAIFDNDPAKIGTNLAGHTVMDIEYLTEYLHTNNIDIGILAIPAGDTPFFAEIFAKNGVKGIWNFAPVSLKPAAGILVENVHISESLMTLAYRIQEKS